MKQQFTVTPEEAGQRLDVFCVSKLPQQSRAAIQKAIKAGDIVVNDTATKSREVVQADDTISINITETAAPKAQLPPPELAILYEDRDTVVIDKPPGIAVHPGEGIASGTVADWFAARYPNSAAVGDVGRPGVVHRLDKDTSGVLILAKTAAAYTVLKEQFQRRRAHKEYKALVFGVPGEKKGRVTRPLARSKRNPLRRTVDPEGKEAATEWWLEEKLGDRFALLKVKPFTGRTHQIRVHLHFLGFPIVGDTLYTFKRQRPPAGVTRQLLHAEKLQLTLPSGTRRTFTSPLPDDFNRALAQLRTV